MVLSLTAEKITPKQPSRIPNPSSGPEAPKICGFGEKSEKMDGIDDPVWGQTFSLKVISRLPYLQKHPRENPKA